MSDQYSIIYSLEPNGSQKGSPVLISGGNLLHDNYYNRLYIQAKFQSISSKVIRDIQVLIEVRDDYGTTVESEYYCYEKLNLTRDQFAGDQEAVPLNDVSGTSFSITVTSVVFNDGTEVTPESADVRSLPEQLPLPCCHRMP